MQWPDRIAAGVLIGVSIFLYIITLSYPSEGAFFPRLLIVSLTGLSINLLIGSYTRRAKGKTLVFEQDELEFPSEPGEGSFISVVTTMGVSLVYIALMPVLGYTLATGAFMVVLAFLLGMRKAHILIFTAVVVSLGIFLMFKIFLKVPLPEGTLFS